MRSDSIAVDVAIVGGGLAGLATARQLPERERSVVVLDARERLGGRLESLRLPGSIVVDLGGQWIGPGQKRVLALQRELGLTTHETFTPGRTLFELQQRLGSYSGSLPWSYPLAFLGVARGIAKLERLAKKLPLDDRQWLPTEAAFTDSPPQLTRTDALQTTGTASLRANSDTNISCDYLARGRSRCSENAAPRRQGTPSICSGAS